MHLQPQCASPGQWRQQHHQRRQQQQLSQSQWPNLQSQRLPHLISHQPQQNLIDPPRPRLENQPHSSWSHQSSNQSHQSHRQSGNQSHQSLRMTQKRHHYQPHDHPARQEHAARQQHPSPSPVDSAASRHTSQLQTHSTLIWWICQHISAKLIPRQLTP
jgi:hypothetical protein